MGVVRFCAVCRIMQSWLLYRAHDEGSTRGATGLLGFGVVPDFLGCRGTKGFGGFKVLGFGPLRFGGLGFREFQQV